MQDTACHHIVYWTIPQIDADRVVVGERHYALNLCEIDPGDASRIESMLKSYRVGDADPSDRRGLRTDPAIVGFRDLFRSFIEVRKRAQGLCQFSMVWMPYDYAEYADEKSEPRHHTHPSVHQLAGAG